MHLPPATERLWQAVQAAPQLRGFVLIGGTALALRIGHRLSEDLDFMHVQPGALPRGGIRQLRESLEASGWVVRANPSPALIAEFEASGKDWADYQQDYIAHEPAGGNAAGFHPRVRIQSAGWVKIQPAPTRLLSDLAGQGATGTCETRLRAGACTPTRFNPRSAP